MENIDIKGKIIDMAQILATTKHNISLVSKELQNGNLASFPTDTVYGLGANSLDESAILKLFDYKNRPKSNPLILHFYAVEQIEEHLIMNDTFYSLLNNFMQGGLTLILNKKPNSKVHPICSGGLKKQAFRIPQNDTCLSLLENAQIPIVASSANKSSQISPTKSEHVLSNFKDKDLLILDDKKQLLGLESTILDISNEDNIELLRHGAVSIEELHSLGIKLNINISSNSRKFYAPKTKIQTNSLGVKEYEGLLAFGRIPFDLPEHVTLLNLSESGDLIEASNNFFDMLIKLDNMNLSKINIMPVPNVGIGVSINQRLLKLSYE